MSLEKSHAEMVTPRASVARAPSLPIVGSLPFYVRDPLAFILRASRQGAIVNICTPFVNTYLLTDPSDIQYVLTTAHSCVIKDAFLRDLRRVVGDGLLTSEGAFWRRQRRLAQPAFHRERVRSYALSMVACTEKMVDGLRDGETRNMHAELMKLTLDIVMRTLFGVRGEGEAPTVAKALDAIMARFASPLPFTLPGYDKLPLPLNRRFREAVRRLDDIILRVIETRRRAPTTDDDDLLAMLLAAQDDDGTRMTDTQLRDEVMTLMLAGHETVANALTWTLLLLAQNPEKDERLASSLREQFGDRTVTLDDLPNLTMVENVVLESMRVYPPAWSIGREVVEPFELRNVWFERGEQIWISQWANHRDPRYFEDPEAFRPERWENGLVKRIPKFAYFPFGGGPRICIGNTFAMMEATLLLATLIRRFRFSLVGNKRVVPLPSVTLRPRGGLPMKITARERGRPTSRSAAPA